MSSGFVTELEAKEARNKRQLEWEKVRKPDDPLEKPEIPYDSRNLYDRLKEQKAIKDLEFEEAHKLKNLVRGLDDDEVNFLEYVDKTKIDAVRKQIMEDNQEILDFKLKVASMQEKSHEDKIHAEINTPKSNRIATKRPSSQKSILSGVIIKKAKVDVKTLNVNNQIIDKNSEGHKLCPSALKTIAILPKINVESLQQYSKSSSSESDDDNTNFDLVGRKYSKQTRNICTYARNILNDLQFNYVKNLYLIYPL